MEKLGSKTEGASTDIVGQNIENLKQLFPDVFTEGKIDFDILRETLGDYIDDRLERYSFNWNGKSRARRIAQTSSTGTLCPCPEESVNWDTTHNLFIEGDNLEVLKLLQKSYHKRVKMIYIDPPYNTGNEFIYPDKFQDNLDTYLRYTGQKDEEGLKLSPNTEASGRYHTNWLNMMYPRLKLARNLICDDGLIFISIDDHEVANLKKICDEIFGGENSLEPIVWKKRYQGAKEKHLVAVHEYILIYTKFKERIENIYVPCTKEYIERYYTNKDENYNKRGEYRTQPLEAGKSMDVRKNLSYSFQGPDGRQISPKRQWVWSRERVEDAMKHGEIGFSEDSQGQLTPYIKQYLKDRNGVIRKTKKQTIIDNVYTQNGTKEMGDIFGKAAVFPFPKPTGLIKQLIEICGVKNNQIILDFFSGSCTSADATMQINADDGERRRCISVQLPEPCDEKSEAFKAGYKTIAEIGKERIRRVAKKLETKQAEKAEQAKEKLPGMESEVHELDLGFKVFKLDSSNIKPWDADFDNLEDSLFNAVENIKSNRSEADVLYELLLKYGLDLAVHIEERQIKKKKVYIIGAGALIVCLAKQISLEVVEGIAALKDELKPEVMRVVFKDSGFVDDVVKTNAVQILRQAGIDDVKSL